MSSSKEYLRSLCDRPKEVGGSKSRNVKQQDAANIVWAAKAADVGVVREVEGGETGMLKAREAEMSRYEEARNASYEIAPEGDVKSLRSSVSLQTLVTKKGQLSESLSSGSC
ncbi:hypothetical protein FOTG_19122 [Fusarium oxysporum f. sp. vasinfectum 25433]|uniref:Uncharacterized protein n=1 Tax=Fusarium oxysporum f. sp. vasinfectum 25433 TaxID=1089449 RepID=X0KUC2_FUSOX|nr:hypothetical protein FOTG_19122 [Fusarium oxysporum f. sp. vasinfectum 25433]